MLSKDIKDRIEYVAGYVQGNLTDWFLVKKEIIVHAFPGQLRKTVGFSKRHRNTKKMLLNEFDLEVIRYWELLTGIKLEIDPEKLHDPNWVHRRKGWALNGGKEKQQQAENDERSKNENPSSDH